MNLMLVMSIQIFELNHFPFLHSDSGCIESEASIMLIYHLTGIYAVKRFPFTKTEILNNKLGNKSS